MDVPAERAAGFFAWLCNSGEACLPGHDGQA